MTNPIQTMETTIQKGRTLRIQNGKDLDLTVVAGSLWVTYEHDTEDTVFEATDKFRVAKDGLTLAHALKDVQLRIAYPVEAGAPSLTLGGGYRDVGASVVRAMFAESLHAIRGHIAAVTGAAQPAGLAVTSR